MTATEKFRNLLLKYPEYDPEAYNFIYEALYWTLAKLGRNKKSCANGHELCDGLRSYAIDQFGCLAATVLSSWRVNSFTDFGRIVFYLAEFDLIAKTGEDSLEDFSVFPDLPQCLDIKPIFRYNASASDGWETQYVNATDSEP